MAAQKPQRKTRRQTFVDKVRPFAYLSPALITIAVLSLVPALWTLYVAFTNYGLYHMRDYHWIGLGNFVEILTGPTRKVFLPVFAWTLAFAIGTTLINYTLGLVLALLLNNEHMRESRIYRTLLIVPWALPSTITILSWTGLLNKSFGAINGMLAAISVSPVPWLTDATWAKISMLLVNLWLGFPFMMTLSLGGLQAIPKELYEAADIDGAGSWPRFRYVTFPQLMSITLPLLIGSFSFNFNNFGIVYLLTGGGPPRLDTALAGTTDNLATMTYNYTMVYQRFGLAAAMGILMFLLVGTLSYVQMRMTRAFEEVD